ncbi:MAG: phosphate ABC transporter substrate-binding protein, PhoT family, partial [Lachnospiraceae bacterium]|nr:phosphate ABC transporter substrate-binding protein, PhoT family [Lachnospiraceae bacterium]
MNKIHNQLLVIVGLIMFFVCLNMGIYNLFTKRCISDYSDGLKAKSIELDRYLPFVEDSELVKVDSELMLEGDLPVLDGAAALYPIFSATVHAIYPQDCVHFDGENFTEESVLQYRNTRGAYKAIV